MYLENTFGDGYDEYDQLRKSTLNLQNDVAYYENTSTQLSQLFKKNLKPSDIKDYIDQQPDTYFDDEVKLTSGHGAFGFNNWQQ